VPGDDWDRREHTIRVWAGRLLIPALAGVLLYAGTYLLGPSWTAHIGGGTHGTFTAAREVCQRRCDWYGSFQPDGGGPARVDVRMGYGNHGITAVGDVVRAIDAGAPNVFPADGGSDWVASAAALGLGAALLLLWAVRVVASLVQRRRNRRDPRPDSGGLTVPA
jgi:hypothetical protein